MGFAGEKLSSDKLATIAAALFVVRDDDTKRKELLGLCPIHGEDNPSFSYNYEKDAYNCLSCDASGDLISLWCHVHGHTDQAEGFKAFCRAHDIERDGGGTRAATGKRQRPEKEKKPRPQIDLSIWGQMAALPQSFIEHLQKSRGWTWQAIQALDLRLQSVYLDPTSQSIKKVYRPERVAFPVVDGGKLYNIRVYKPGASDGAKIMSWGKGFGSAALFPDPAKLQPTGPVFLVEGEPDTVCAWSQGLNAITQTSKLVKWPEHHRKHFKNRDVVICYDADQAGEKYAAHAAAALHGVAKSIRFLIWPDFMGKQADGTWPEKHGQDLTDYFVRYGRSIDDFQALVAAARHYEPPPEEKAVSVQPDGVQFFRKHNDRWTFIPRWLANQIMKDIPLMYDPLTSLLYKWNGRYWEEYHEDNLKKIAINYLGDESKMQRVSDATAQARLLSTIPHGRTPNDKINWLCLENKMLDISNLEGDGFSTKPHDKDFYSTYSLNVSLTDEVIPCDRWKQFLEETVQTPEVIRQIQEFTGYCLTRETKYGKCLFLLGPGSDGKSTYLKTVRKLVGPQNCAAVAFRDMEDQFYRSSLYGKLLNISTEVGNRAMESMYFKAIVTGDPISAAFKNKTPFEFVPFCKLAFAANKLPRVLDNSDGFFRRVLPVRFKQQFFGAADDKGLEEALEQELSGILQWALVGLHRLRQQKDFTWCDETNDLLLEYKRQNNPVLCFVEDRCELGPSLDVKKDGLYEAYAKYCYASGYKALSKVHFFRELATVRSGLNEARMMKQGKRDYYLKGICLSIEGE